MSDSSPIVRIMPQFIDTGTAAVIGALRLRAEFAALEAHAKAGGRAEVQAAWPGLHAIWQATLTELEGLPTGSVLPADRA